MIVRKRDGSIQKLSTQPDMVIHAPDIDSILCNAGTLASKMLCAMQRATHGAGYAPTQHDTKMLKELVDVAMMIDAHRQRTASNDALAQLSEDELIEKLRALAAKKLT